MSHTQKNLIVVLSIVLVIVAIILMWDLAFGFTHSHTGLNDAITKGVESLKQ